MMMRWNARGRQEGGESEGKRRFRVRPSTRPPVRAYVIALFRSERVSEVQADLGLGSADGAAAAAESIRRWRVSGFYGFALSSLSAHTVGRSVGLAA